MTHDPDATRPTWTDPAPTSLGTQPAPGTAPAQDPPIAPPTSTAVAPVAPVLVSRRRSSGRWVNLLLGAAAILAVGGVAFAIGRSTAPAAALAPGGLVGTDGGGVIIDGSGSFDPGAVPGGGQGRPGAGGAAFLGGGSLAIDGTVTAVDGSTLTIELASGETTTVTLDDTTTYHEATASDAGEIAVGDDVSVRVAMDGGPRAGTGGGAPDLMASDVTVIR